MSDGGQAWLPVSTKHIMRHSLFPVCASCALCTQAQALGKMDMVGVLGAVPCPFQACAPSAALGFPLSECQTEGFSLALCSTV